jgi:hypothetical protein
MTHFPFWFPVRPVPYREAVVSAPRIEAERAKTRAHDADMALRYRKAVVR